MSGVIYAKRPKISGDVRELDTRFRTIDSTVNQLKVYMAGSGSVRMQKVEEWGDDKEIIDIAHNLGYQPFLLVGLSGRMVQNGQRYRVQ